MFVPMGRHRAAQGAYLVFGRSESLIGLVRLDRVGIVANEHAPPRAAGLERGTRLGALVRLREVRKFAELETDIEAGLRA